MEHYEGQAAVTGAQYDVWQPRAFASSRRQPPILGQSTSSDAAGVKQLLGWRRRHSLEHELLGPATIHDFRRVGVAVRIRGHVVENVELTGLIAHSASEITEDLERLAVEDQYPLMAPVNNVQVALLRIW